MEKFKKIIKKPILLVLVIVLAIAYNTGYKVYIVDGDSMNPSLDNLDFVLVDKLSYSYEDPQKGDVVVFYHSGFDEVLVKRIIATSGDTVEITSGYMLINGKPFMKESGELKLIKLSSGEYWAIGDNLHDSWYGVVYGFEIIGKLK